MTAMTAAPTVEPNAHKSSMLKVQHTMTNVLQDALIFKTGPCNSFNTLGFKRPPKHVKKKNLFLIRPRCRVIALTGLYRVDFVR